MTAVLENGSLSDALDADDALATLVSFATEGNVDGLADLITDSGWCRQVGIFRLIHATGTTHASPELLDILLSVIDEVNDNDALATASWAVGACVRALGADGARMVLDKCRDDYGNGSVKKCMTLNAVLRLEADDAAVSMVNGLLDEIAEADEDGDTVKAIGRVRTGIAGGLATPIEWLFPVNFGRVIDLYEPQNDTVVPTSVCEALEPGAGSMPAATVGYVVAGAMDAMLTALLTSRAAAMDTSVVSVYRDWFTGESKLDGDQKTGLAATMVLSEVDHGLSPVLLRCYLGADCGGHVPSRARPSVN